MSTAATASIARPYSSPPRFPSATTRLLSSAEEYTLFTDIRAAHYAAWAACLAAPGAVDGREHDPEWYALRAAQDAAVTHAAHAERTATDGAEVLDAWILRHDVTDTRRTLERLVDRALKANLRLATHLAARYHRSILMLGDRVQAAAMGVLRAIRDFDPARNLKFSTYATSWIEHYIQRADMDTSATIRVPVHMQETRRKVAKAARRHEEETGGAISLPALVAATGRKEEAVRQALRLPYCVSADSSPFAKAHDRDDDRRVLDSIADDAPSVEDLIDERERVAVLAAGINRLPARTADIVRARYLGEDGPEDLSVIGARMGLSRERIRQLAADGVRTLQVVVPRMMGF